MTFSSHFFNRPVFDRQVGDLTESTVVSHQYRAYAHCMRGNQQIQWRYALALTLHISSHRSITLGNGAIPRQHIEA